MGKTLLILNSAGLILNVLVFLIVVNNFPSPESGGAPRPASAADLERVLAEEAARLNKSISDLSAKLSNLSRDLGNLPRELASLGRDLKSTQAEVGAISKNLQALGLEAGAHPEAGTGTPVPVAEPPVTEPPVVAPPISCTWPCGVRNAAAPARVDCSGGPALNELVAVEKISVDDSGTGESTVPLAPPASRNRPLPSAKPRWLPRGVAIAAAGVQAFVAAS